VTRTILRHGQQHYSWADTTRMYRRPQRPSLSDAYRDSSVVQTARSLHADRCVPSPNWTRLLSGTKPQRAPRWKPIAAPGNVRTQRPLNCCIGQQAVAV